MVLMTKFFFCGSGCSRDPRDDDDDDQNECENLVTVSFAASRVPVGCRVLGARGVPCEVNLASVKSE